MKNFAKIVLGALLAISLLSVSACGGNSKQATDQAQERSFQGELSELTSFINGLDVTHVLVTTAKERVFLRSLLFDLEDFEGKEVRVTGLYSEEDVSNKPVNVLTVDKIDILSDADLFSTDLDSNYESDFLGLSFSYPSLLFDVSESDGRVSLKSVENDATINIKRFKTSIELDSEVFVSANYDSFDFDEVRVGSGRIDALTNIASDPSKVVYILKRTGHFYELTFTDFTGDVDGKYDEVLDEMLATFEFIPVDAPEEDIEEEEDSDEDADTTEEDTEEEQSDASDDSSTNDVQEEEVEVKTSTGSSKDPIINAFYKVDSDIIGNVDNYVSFAFTDNNYFYVIYVENDVQKRALVSYTNDNRFARVATFKKGAIQDWDLVSGNNVAYNRPLTLVMVGEEESTELALEQGYRYFESLPLGFGMQYPMDWYYARNDDTYEFSDKPDGSTLVSAEVLDSGFASAPGDKVTNRVKQANNTTYYVDLDDSVLKITGKSKNSAEIRVMATSVVVKKTKQ